MRDRTAAGLLKQARQRAGVSQSELARRARIPQSVLSAYERGRRQPGVDAMDRILAAAGYGLTLRPRPDPLKAGRRLRDLLGLVDRLPPTRRRRLEYPRLPMRNVR
jgi:transcriptional regulator with XRE-family HTH domain